jgi:uncharacterized protein
MVTLATIEQDLTAALKERHALVVEVLRALKTRIQNEQIAKMTELSDQDIQALLRSETKRRKEATLAYEQGNRPELAVKEQQEIAIIARYLPPEVPEHEIVARLEQLVAEQGLTAAQFGPLMGQLKQAFPQADGAVLARLAKAKLGS